MVILIDLQENVNGLANDPAMSTMTKSWVEIWSFEDIFSYMDIPKFHNQVRRLICT